MKRTLRDNFSPRGALVRLATASFLAYTSYALCWTPLRPLFARALGAGPSLIGLVMGALTLTGVFVKLPAGALSDLLGRRRLLLTGAVIFAALPFTYLAVSTLPVLALLRGAHGSATAIFGPVAAASLSDIAPAGKRGAWLSTYSTAQGAGQALGPVPAGYLIAVGRFDYAFAAAGLIALGVPVIVSGWRDTLSVTTAREPWQEFKRGIAEVSADRLVLATSGAQAAQFVLHGALTAFLPLYGRDALGLTVTQVGWFGVQSLTTLAVRPAIGWVSDRVGRRWVVVAGLVVCSTAVALVSLGDVRNHRGDRRLRHGCGDHHGRNERVHHRRDAAGAYGAAHGVFGTIYDVGDALGPIAAGVLISCVGYSRMFQVIAAFALTMAVAFGVASRPSRLCPPGERAR
jgi:MFS transporter, DHA1 family, multidrug resistance protein